MKTRVIIISFIIFSSAYSFSQDKINLNDFYDNTTYFSISYLAGTSFSFESGNTGIPVGYNGGIEIGYYPSGSTAFFMNFNVNRLRPSESHGNLSFTNDVIEITIGPRLYLSKNKTFFVEGAIGTYMFNKTFTEKINNENSPYYFTDGVSGFGFEIGCGNDFILSKSTTLSLKARLNNTYPDLQNYFYIGVYSALSFDNRDNSNKSKNPAAFKTWALTLIGGINNPGFFYNTKYKWGVNYGIDAAFKTSPKTEYYLSVVNNNILSDNNYYSLNNVNNYIFEIETGPRFIFNLNKVSPLFETGIGLYDHYTTGTGTGTFQNFSASALGFNLGTGILVNLTESAGLIAKGKLNFIFSKTFEPGSYFTVNSGVRVYL